MLCNSASFPDRILSTDSATVEASKKAAEQALEIAENKCSRRSFRPKQDGETGR
jgi:hypothetical protein